MISPLLEEKSKHSIEEASIKALTIMSRLIDINTLFVAKNDRHTNKVVKVINNEVTLLEEGSALPFEETLCNIAVKGGNQTLIIQNLLENEMTKNLDVTKNLGGGSFIGIPIYYENGENYGTICGLDTNTIDFNEDHVELFQTMAALLTSVIEVERAYHDIHYLSVPLVPVKEGIAILPIIGKMDEKRVELIMEIALEQSQVLSLHYLIIDLSGVVEINGNVATLLSKVASSLKLVGVNSILTGIRPELALKAIKDHADFKDIKTYSTLKQALSNIDLSS